MATDWPPMERRGASAAETALAAFEAQIETTLPEDYRAFLLEVNGGRTASSHCRFRVRNDQAILNSLYSLDDPQEQRDLTTQWQGSRQKLPREVIPLGYDGFGGQLVLVIAGPRRGQVWFLDGADPRPEGANPRVEWFDRRDVVKIADSFREFMDNLTTLTQ